MTVTEIRIDPEFKSLIPPLTTDDRQRLEASIKAEGCRDPLVLWGDILVDGHNRYDICKAHNIPFQTVSKDFNDRNEAMLWMINNQLARRNLSTADRIILAQKQKPILESIAKEKQRQAGRENGRGMTEIACVKSDSSYSQEKPKRKTSAKKKRAPQVREQIAKAAGVSTGTVTKFETVQEEEPELVEVIRNKVISIDAAYNQVKEKRRAEKEAKREEQRQENAEKIKELATPLEAQGLFQTIVIDPPWDWGDEGDINQFGRAKPDYHTMPIEDIEKLPIAKIADDNCHLYLWVTNRSLPKAFRLIEAWGFRYITCLTWVKPSIGMGNYFRGDTEQVLFAVKGSQPLKRKDVGTHFEAPRGQGHSAKPDLFYDLVESCSYGPYIDIFGRKDRQGWSVWGENG